MKVLGIIGSSRKRGNTEILLRKSLETFDDSDEVKIIRLSDYNFRGCIGCEGCQDTYKCVINDEMQKIYPLILEADGIILASPTYFYNITSEVKAFIDRLYCFESFDKTDRSVWLGILKDKFAITLAICEQNNEKDMGFTSEAMTMPLEALGIRVVENVKALYSFKKGEVLNDKDIVKKAINAGEKLKKTIRLYKNTNFEKLI